ncbi:MAG: hypothetical protein ACJAYU_003056 [Bradymonadia bacterium]|jgi:hypothetical protein
MRLYSSHEKALRIIGGMAAACLFGVFAAIAFEEGDRLPGAVLVVLALVSIVGPLSVQIPDDGPPAERE